MAKKTPINVKLLVATLPSDANISEWCRKLGISRETAYYWRRRYAEEGQAGLEERSRAPKTVHGKTDSAIEDLVVQVRQELLSQGLDHGSASVADTLRTNHDIDLVDSLVWRILSRRGQIEPQPKKRPRSSWKSWERSRPNQCWQGDDTHYILTTNTEVKVINMLDDHSRLNVESRAALHCTSEAIWEAFCYATERYGVPAEFLNDNGRAWISHVEFNPNIFQGNLLALGVRQIHSSPYHPQTCGKTERFHQTQRRWLDAQPQASTIEELQILLDRFRMIYNDVRKHRGIGRVTPKSRWSAQAPAAPPTQALEGPLIVAICAVLADGTIHPANKITVGIGTRWVGTSIAVIRRGCLLTVISVNTGETVREIALEPGRYYYGTGKHPRRNKPQQSN